MVVITSSRNNLKVNNTDLLNHYCRRKQNNTNRHEYNCGGFALGTFSWYCPYDESILDYAVSIGEITQEQRDDIISHLTEDRYYDFVDEQESWGYTSEDYVDYNSWCSYQAMEELMGILPNDKRPFNCDLYLPYFQLYMLNDFPDMRAIQEYQKHEVKEDEYIIAFRVGDYDFHYARNNKGTDDIWIHKVGRRSIEKFSEFPKRYNSTTLYFAKKRK